VIGTESLNEDTDRDGLNDGDEVITHQTDPLVADSDGDGFSDGDEIDNGMDPLRPTLAFCLSIEGYSDGSAGDLTLDAATGALTLNGDTNDSRFHDSTTLGTAYDDTVIFENIDNFIVPANTIINSLGTTIINAKRIVIDGTLNGNGGGFIGGARRTSYNSIRNNGSGPPSTNGGGQGGRTYSGGAGAGHGKLVFVVSHVLTQL